MRKKGYYFITNVKNRNPYLMRVSAIRLSYILFIIGLTKSSTV